MKAIVKEGGFLHIVPESQTEVLALLYMIEKNRCCDKCGHPTFLIISEKVENIPSDGGE